MPVIQWNLQWKNLTQGSRKFLRWKLSQLTLTIRSLTFNAHLNYNYVVDLLLEPIFWIADNFAGYLGKIFVILEAILTACVVFVAYWVGLPYWWLKSPATAVFLVVFGNWLLLNILFHYYMGVVTPPGYPPPGSNLPEVASICKKCISPKPARTHHCSVCDRCILKMDHHCPWLNNCVGFYNARYFFLFMVYMGAGVLFVILAGFEIGVKVIWLNDTGGIMPEGHRDPDLIGHPVRLNQSGALVPVHIVEYDSENAPREHDLPVPPITEAQRIAADPLKRKAVMFMAVVCVAVLIATSVLIVMHGRHISHGETSVEAHINAKLRRQYENYRNPYDFGRRKNWKLFLGLTQGRSFVRTVLLPSRHPPTGLGLVFHTVHNAHEDWP